MNMGLSVQQANQNNGMPDKITAVGNTTVMVFFADAFVAMRNDLPGGEHRVMWTGNVDKVWPPEAF